MIVGATCEGLNLRHLRNELNLLPDTPEEMEMFRRLRRHTVQDSIEEISNDLPNNEQAVDSNRSLTRGRGLAILWMALFPKPGQGFLTSSPSSARIPRIPTSISILRVEPDNSSPVEDAALFYSPNVPLHESQRDKLENVEGDSDDGDSNDALSGANVNEYSFFDEAIIYVRAGSGGQGSSTYKKVAGQNGPPDGGNGGKGGSVILEMDPSLNTLAGLTNAWRPNSFGGSGAAYTSASFQSNRPKSFRAENGADGERQFRSGRYGKDVTIRVPPGTVVQEILGDANDSNAAVKDVATITEENPQVLVAMGGDGGEGSGIQAKSRGVRRARAAPTGGERRLLKLTLKIVADVAIVAVPSAGKSTLLAAVTRAKPKIANYPFTTVIPNLGVWTPALPDSANAGSDGLVLCDVPGLIEGASQGRGLGHAFLRHVERCHVILHLVDATSNDPIADYEMINREIVKYGTGQLAKMPQVVVVNKVDAFDGRAAEDWEEGLQVKFSRKELEAKLKETMPHTRLMWMSAKEHEGVDDLMARLAAFVKKVKQSNEA